MKRLLVLLLFYAISNSSNAQDECKCVPITTYNTITKVLCGGYDGYDGANHILNPNALVIDIKYQQIICGSDTLTDVYSFTTHSPLWNYQNDGYTPPLPAFINCVDVFPLDANGWPRALDPSSEALWDDWSARMIAKYLPFPYNTNPGHTVIIQSKCKALVMVEWPRDAVYTIPPGDGGGPPITIPMTTSIMWADCDKKVCCKMKGVQSKDHIIFEYVNLVAPYDNCGEIVPDFVPKSNNYEGTILSQTKCAPLCKNNIVSSFMTDLTEAKKVDLTFSAVPTLFNDFIKITTPIPIKRIEMYDLKGQKIIDDASGTKEINTSKLKPGTYFMRVYLENNQLNTVKLFKID